MANEQMARLSGKMPIFGFFGLRFCKCTFGENKSIPIDLLQPTEDFLCINLVVAEVVIAISSSGAILPYRPGPGELKKRLDQVLLKPSKEP